MSIKLRKSCEGTIKLRERCRGTEVVEVRVATLPRETVTDRGTCNFGKITLCRNSGMEDYFWY